MDGRVTGLALGAAFVLAVFAGRLAVLAYVAVLTAMAAGEIYRLSRSRGFEPVPLVGLLGIGAILFAAHMRGDTAPTIFPAIVSAIIASAFIAVMARRRQEQITRGIAYTLLPVLTVGLLASHVVVVRGERDGTVLALLLGAMIATAEIGAWAAHRWLRIGRERGGTYIRLGGAVAGSAVAGAIGSLLAQDVIGTADSLALGAVVGIATSIGEQVGTMVEEDLLTKETGVTRSPAGMLRRIDGALLGAPVFFYVLRMLAR